MNQTARIVCGTDLSSGAARAADVAAGLARRLQAPLSLVCVCEPAAAGGTAAKLRTQVLTLDREALHREAERLRASGAVVEEEMLSGFPDQELVTLAGQPGVKLVVVASHGHRALARWWLGSVAERTAEAAPVPTLVIRDAAPFEAWLRGESPLRVFVGTDFTAQSEAALHWVRGLREIGSCEVLAAYLAWMPAPTSPDFSAVPELTAEFHESEEEVSSALRRKVVEVLGEPAPQIQVAAGMGRVDARLVELAAEAGSHLIVVGSHQWHGVDRLWHRSVSRGILHHAPMNVACVPAPPARA